MVPRVAASSHDNSPVGLRRGARLEFRGNFLPERGGIRIPIVVLFLSDQPPRMGRPGMRPIQIWVPDVRAPAFCAQAQRPAPMHEPTRPSSTRYRIGAMNEARRHLDGRRGAALCGHRARRQFRWHGFHHQPNQRDGLRTACRLMVDKITTVSKAKIGARIGRLSDEDMVRLNRAMTVFLGMAVSPRVSREKAS